MKRGDVWWVNFDPSISGEIRKKRSAVIVSNDGLVRSQAASFIKIWVPKLSRPK